MFEIGERVREDGNCGTVFGEFLGIDLVQCVGRGVVIAKLGAGILDRAEGRNTGRAYGVDIRAWFFIAF